MRLPFLTFIVSPVLFVGALTACGSSTSTSATTAPVRESIGLQAPTQSQGSAAGTVVAATSPGTGLPALTAPPPTTVAVTTTVPLTYVVQAGDQLKRIAKKFGVSVTELMTVNSIANADKIEAGQTLIIPPTTAAGATRATQAPLPATTRTTVAPTATTAKRP